MKNQSCWVYWRIAQNAADDPQASAEAQRKIEQFHREIEDIRVAVFQKQQQIEALQKANQGWMVWRSP
jgi:hypothetical protein